MTQIIAIINQKGGVAKTTTAMALGFGLQRSGYKVLFVDLDPQANMTCALAAGPGPTTLDLLANGEDALRVIQQTPQCDVMPATQDLAAAGAIPNTPGREYRLKNALEPIREAYDYIIIDTPPALNILPIMAMTAATGLIITAKADIFSLHGFGQLYDTIQVIRQNSNPDLEIMGILLTQYKPRTILGRDIAETLRQTAKQLNTRLYKTTIRDCISLQEAEAVQQDIFTYAPRSNAAQDYAALTTEILKRGKNHGKQKGI